MWNRIIYLRDSSTVEPDKQLVELSARLAREKYCRAPDDSAHTLLLQRIGWLVSLQNNFNQAVDYSLQAVNIIKHAGGSRLVNPQHLVMIYYNLQMFYDSLHLSNEKEAAIDSCISLALQLKTGYDYATYLMLLKTQNFFAAGDYYRCENYAEVEENMLRLSGYQATDVLPYLAWRINSFIFLNRFDEAEKIGLDAIAEGQHAHDTNSMGSIYGSMANIAAERKDVKKALHYSDLALQYDKRVNNESYSATLNNLGFKVYFLHLKQYDSALSYYRKSLVYASPSGALNTLGNIAVVHAQKRDFDSAFIYFQRAFDVMQPGTTEMELLKNYASSGFIKNIADYVFGLVLDKADAYQLKYKAYRHKEDILKAIGIYRVADNLLNEIKKEQAELKSRLFWRQQARHLYEQAISAAYQADDYSSAFYFFEKSRAVLLQDQLNELNQFSNDRLAEQGRVKARIKQIQLQLHQARGQNDQIGFLLNELIKADQLLDKVQQPEAKKENPLTGLDRFDSSMLTLDKVQHTLLKGYSGLVELFAGDSTMFALIVTTDQVRFIKIDKKDFDASVDAYTKYISNLSALNSHFGDYISTANHLYELIFDHRALPAGRLIISPDGKYFPFESLVKSLSPDPAYLLRDYAVSYTYSARFLQNMFNASSSASSGNFLGLAPIDFQPQLKLSSLAGSNASLQTIAGYVAGASLLTAKQATKANFLKGFPYHKIIQLYTHAADSSEQKEPVIYFSDSVLYLSDLIPDQKLLTRLIVLSACETGNGTLYQGEGVFSFNRGFAALGIPSSVTNLWSIDNLSTYQLTELFYKYLSAGLPLDLAMQKAKLEYLNRAEGENRLPYYWAAPILVGKTDPILLDKPFRWMYAFAGLAGLAGLLYFGWKTWYKKRFNPVQDTAQTVP